jgi:AhpD family alkylhydroperoxidase
MSPHVELLDAGSAPIAVRARFFGGGDPGPIASSLAHVPELLEVALPFFDRALAGVTIDRRTAELVIVRSSAVLGCRYCTLTHGATALGSGVRSEELVALCDVAHQSSVGDERERALLAWVDAAAGGRGEVPGELLDPLRRWIDDATLVEVSMMVGCTILLNRYCSALQLPVSSSSIARLQAVGIDAGALGFTETSEVVT